MCVSHDALCSVSIMLHDVTLVSVRFTTTQPCNAVNRIGKRRKISEQESVSAEQRVHRHLA